MRDLSPAARALARRQRGVLTREQLLACGVTRSAIDHALRTGRWQRMLPGIYSVRPADGQRLAAALLHVGTDAALDGLTACHLLGLRAGPEPPQVHVVLRHDRRIVPTPWIAIRRTVHPFPTVTVDGLVVLPIAHAVVAASTRLPSRDDVRSLVAEAVQRRRTSVAAVDAALATSPRRGRALVRAVLEEVRSGVRSAPEARFVQLVKAAGLPLPVLNCRLLLGDQWLADPDAYWPEAGLVHETDSREWHLSPDSWEATMRRHARMTAAGLSVIHSSPRRIRSDPATLARELRSAYAAGTRRGPVPGIRVVTLAGRIDTP